ncbi:hypothetical protein F4809DRAFT_399167 [Biscogniauxia mediterranea]|nr:hypothetical protein F4809DRAFT_399167 [Biscogniauxia mediterranea]
MISSRVGVRALRQAASKPNTFFSHNVPRLALAHLQTRGAATTQNVTADEARHLLETQRKNRPVSPHLSAYDYGQTWFGSSIWTRITGSIFAGSLYLFSAAYVVAPLTGWHLESASLAEAAAAAPYALKSGLKFLVAWPFAFHLFNGTRHLVWDFAVGFNRTVIKQGSWVIWTGSLVTALGLAFLL